MEQHTTTTTEKTTTSMPNGAVNGLAIIGFIALLVLGILLAIYAVRYVPGVVSRLSPTGSTTPSLTAVQNSANQNVPLYGYGPTVATTSTIGPTYTPPASYQSTKPSYTYPPSTSSYHYQTPHVVGLPDLAVQGIITGYLANGSNESFVPAQVIPPGARPAVQFSIANSGGSATGPWGFVAELPTANGYVFTSPVEPSMGPGDHTVFTLGFDQANPFPGPQVVTVIADPNNQINEASEANNSQSAAFQIGY